MKLRTFYDKKDSKNRLWSFSFKWLGANRHIYLIVPVIVVRYRSRLRDLVVFNFLDGNYMNPIDRPVQP